MIKMKLKCLAKIIAIFSAFCLLFTAYSPLNSVFAATNASLSEQRDELKKKLRAAEKKLDELGEESKDTEEYIAVLDEKISYLNKQYSIAKSETQDIEKKVNSLENNISANESEISSIQTEIEELEQNILILNEEFSGTYKNYCERIRAIYISGSSSSILTFLLTSDGISNLLTRYEMINAISKRDGELLESVKTQTEKIVEAKTKLDEKNKNLVTAQKELKTNRESLKSEQVILLEKEEAMQKQQAEIEEQQMQANELLKELHDKTRKYGEYRDITQEELDAIDADIEAADKKYPAGTTTTTATTTTKKTTSSNHSQNSSDDGSTTKKPNTTKNTTKKTTAGSKYISLTYPCPKYTTITCAFGAYSGHTGCDFSTKGHENQKIVAAESGTVILVKLLERSYGHYVVIRHDKTTSSGKSVYTLYAHNNDIIVSEGQYVKKGQQIAYSGTTGNSTGPHCHFEVRVGGSSQSYAVNPANYLP